MSSSNLIKHLTKDDMAKKAVKTREYWSNLYEPDAKPGDVFTSGKTFASKTLAIKNAFADWKLIDTVLVYKR